MQIECCARCSLFNDVDAVIIFASKIYDCFRFLWFCRCDKFACEVFDVVSKLNQNGAERSATEKKIGPIDSTFVASERELQNIRNVEI